MINEPEDLNLTGEENDLYEHFRFIVDKGQALLRIDKFLQSKLPSISRNKIQNAAHAGSILVNGAAIKPNHKVHPSDIISIVLTVPPRETDIIPEDLPIEIVYEDDELLVVNKAAGMVVHPAHGNFNGTLLNALLFKFLSDPNKDIKPYLVHRIDKDTSGLLLVAKNEISQSILARSFFDHKVDRRYVALVWGDIKEVEGTIHGHIGRSLRDRQMMDVFVDGSYGKEATTHYKVIQRFNYVTLVECILETGRTHQIRAHMKHIGHPLFSDAKYGGDQILKGTTFTKYKQFVNNCFEILPRQALHARTLSFVHPKTGKLMKFESELPDDMKQVISKWENYCLQDRI
ncbi:MAG: RluA family pseudouridine synthase [Bacteroidales bacterium]|nr:RluA family pseudouridine synthase [Bacteroidales bacterium]